jgi:hypothetical protein
VNVVQASRDSPSFFFFFFFASVVDARPAPVADAKDEPHPLERLPGHRAAGIEA